MGRTAYGIKQRLSGIRFLLAAPGGEGSNRRAPSSGWFYMLRASEYILAVDLLSVSFRVWRERPGLLKDGHQCPTQEADSLAVQLRALKETNLGGGILDFNMPQAATGDMSRQGP